MTLSDFMYFNLQSFYWTDTHARTHVYMTEELELFQKCASVSFKLWSYNRRIIGAFNHSGVACVKSPFTCVEKKLQKDQTPWRWRQWVTKHIGVKISAWYNIQNSAQKVEFVNSGIVVYLTSRYWLCLIGCIWVNRRALRRSAKTCLVEFCRAVAAQPITAVL